VNSTMIYLIYFKNFLVNAIMYPQQTINKWINKFYKWEKNSNILYLKVKYLIAKPRLVFGQITEYYSLIKLTHKSDYNFKLVHHPS
jgi:hypothetical protein